MKTDGKPHLLQVFSIDEENEVQRNNLLKGFKRSFFPVESQSFLIFNISSGGGTDKQ